MKDLLVAVGDFRFGIRSLLFGGLQFVLDLNSEMGYGIILTLY